MRASALITFRTSPYTFTFDMTCPEMPFRRLGLKRKQAHCKEKEEKEAAAGQGTHKRPARSVATAACCPRSAASTATSARRQASREKWLAGWGRACQSQRTAEERPHTY